MPSKDPEKIRATSARYREKTKDLLKERKRKAYQDNRETERARQSDYKRKNPETIRRANKTWRDEFWPGLRKEMLNAYGPVCACCGETEERFLELDHIFNDGYQQRMIHKNGRCEMLALKRAGWPKERHQVLCANCNSGKARNGGICPHKVKNIQS